MTRERIVRMFAGAMVLIGLALGFLVNHWWFALCAFVGLNLFQSGATRWCLLENILEKGFGVPSEADLVRRASSGAGATKPPQ